MTLLDVGVLDQQIDVVDGGVHPDGRLLSVAEIQQAYRALIRRRTEGTATGPDTTSPATSSRRASPRRLHTSPTPVRTGPHTSSTLVRTGSYTPPSSVDAAPHTSSELAGPVSDAVDGAALERDWVAVVSAHSGAGASSVALALGDAFDAAGRSCRLIEAADPSRSGLVAAATAELGNDPTGAWRRGSRRRTTLYRRTPGTPPVGWPEPTPDAATVVDLGLPAADTVLRLVADRPCIVLVCRVTVPGMRLAEHLLTALAGTSIVLAAVGPGRWPGEVVASLGPRLREIRQSGLVTTVPNDRHLQVSGPTNSALPKSVSHAGRDLLTLIDAVRPRSAGTALDLTAKSAPRKEGTTR